MRIGILIILLTLWSVGTITEFGGPLIHILLIAAVAVLMANLFSSRRTI